jgi:hypothetical protein
MGLLLMLIPPMLLPMPSDIVPLHHKGKQVPRRGRPAAPSAVGMTAMMLTPLSLLLRTRSMKAAMVGIV